MKKCFYCEQKAAYEDLVVINDEYQISDVCKKHFSISLTS
jgi:hypothetical protein